MAISTQRVGDRLRSIRRQKGLSLHEVEAMSNEEFKASVLGAYERGERVISVPRLMRLANVYGVPPEQLLPKEVEVDLTEPGAMDLSEGFAVDLNRLQECREPEALALARLVAMIQAERQDFNGRVLTVRGDDLRALAYFLLTTPEELCGRLTGMGLQALPGLLSRVLGPLGSGRWLTVSSAGSWRGSVPSTAVLETEHCYAFRDINPAAPVHVLVVPKEHLDSVEDVGAGHGEILGDLFAAIRAVAAKEGMAESGYRVVTNVGEDAGQLVHAPPLPRPRWPIAPLAAEGERCGRVVLAPGLTPDQQTQVKVLVPGNHLMVSLLGQRDELLRLVEAAFPVSIHVRGNEITVSGELPRRSGSARLFEEMVLLLESGNTIDRENLGRTIDMLKADERPSDVLNTAVLRGRKTIRPKTAGQKRYVDAILSQIITFGIGPAGTGKSYLAVALAVQALQAKQVNRIVLTRPAVEAGERLGFLPGDVIAKVDPYLRPLYDALYDMVEPEAVARLMERGAIEVAPLAFMRGRAQPVSSRVLTPGRVPADRRARRWATWSSAQTASRPWSSASTRRANGRSSGSPRRTAPRRSRPPSTSGP